MSYETKHHPAHRRAVRNSLQPLRDRAQGKPFAHQGLDHSVSGELGQLVVADAHQGRVLVAYEEEVQTQDLAILDQGVVKRGRLICPTAKETTRIRPPKAMHLARANVPGLTGDLILTALGSLGIGELNKNLRASHGACAS